ncbi:hypothetical protein Rs2_11252 [Raphanus sativus]|nr:hypothetical protein Rs2_11252 [Raphanus sativus]
MAFTFLKASPPLAAPLAFTFLPRPPLPDSFLPPPLRKQRVVRCSITRRERHEKRVRDEVETLHKKNLKGEISSDDLEAKVIRFGITPTPDLMGEFKTLLKMKNSAPLVTRVAEERKKNESDAKKPPKQGWVSSRSLPRRSRNKLPPVFMAKKIEEDVKRLGDEVEKEMGKGTDDGLAAAVKKIKKTLAHYGAIPSDTEARRLAGLGKKDFQKADKGKKPSGGGKGKAGGDVEKTTPSGGGDDVERGDGGTPV